MANRIEIIIDGDNIKAVNAISGVETQLKKLDTKSKSSGSILDSVFGSLSSKIAFGAAAAVTGFGMMMKSAVDLGDEINDLSKKSGMSAENLSTMKYAAELSGSSLDQLGSLVIKLNKNIYEAGSGNKELAKTFYQLGIPVKDAQGNFIQTDQALYKLADRFKDMPDGAQKSALAIQIFGKSGADMIPMLNEGSAGLMKMQEEARKLGLEISQKTAAQMDEFNDKLAKVEGSFKGLAISLVTNIGPTITKVLTNFSDGLDVIFGKIQVINGVQYKEQALSLIAINEITASLAGTTQEYRDNEIKSLQNQIYIARSLKEANEYDLKQLEMQGAISVANLITSEKERSELGEKIKLHKTEISLLTQKIDIIKNFGQAKPPPITLTDPKNADLEKQRAKDRAAYAEEHFQYIEKQKQKWVDASDKQWQTERDNQNKINEKLAASADFRDMITQKQMDDYIAKSDWQDQIRRQQIAEEEAQELMRRQMAADTFGSLGDSLLQFAQLSGETNKGLFAAAKGFSIAQAIMNTYEGATKALAQGGFWGFAMAAAVVVAGLANVARIAAQQPTSNAAGASGASYSQPALPSPRTIQNNSVSNSTQTVVHKTLNINGDVLDVQAWLRKNRSAIQRFFDDGNIDLAFG